MSRETAAEFARLALEDGIGTFIVSVNAPRGITDFASKVVPRVRDAVEEARLRGPEVPRAAVGAASVSAEAAVPDETEDERR